MTCLPLLLASIAAQETPAGTVKGLATPAGLTVTLWASEPQFYNPTNIDIDERGRVWVLEAVNYRRQLRRLPDHRGGDRIVILEDTNLDGRADKVKVFDAGPHLRSPLGIAVLGDKVIVSQSPDVFVYTRDAEDRVVSREVFLTGFRGVDHDHGVHAFVFGPDGRYYFNAGDQGLDVADRSGARISTSHQGPYYAGTALRINRDGTGLTSLGHNFRNPYELAVDSWGHIWQSDNDDDGNAWTRLNYVLAGGNFGYWGPGGRSWFEDRSTHFHQENPGVVPNIARMGAGSPCGMTVYEGSLLPDAYRSRIMHAEAGKRFLNTYTFRPAGAGYTVETEHTVRADDMWFRPSDVAVGPDGAVYIADWYDPAVGGHQMGDTARGRIYRLAPAGFRPAAVNVDLESEDGLAAALASPAQSVRYLAWMKLHEQGAAALPALLRMARRGDPLLRARALWLLAPLGGNGEREVRAALRDPDPNFRVLALRALAASGADAVDLAKSASGDPSPIVLREAAVMLAGVSSDAAVDTLATLALRHGGRDRWYLAALGIGARGKESQVYARLRERIPIGWTSTLGQLVWEMRPPEAIPFAAGVFQDPKRSAGERQQALDALAAQPSLEAARLVTAAAAGEAGALRDRAFEHLSRRVFSEWSDVRTAPEVRAAAAAALKSPAVRKRAIEFIADLGDASFNAELLALANDGTAETELRAAAVRALGSAKAGEATFRMLLMSAAPN
ncbi:MAG: PVC-type heme-binding CxxCH protein, partial [Bryobacteraceae bacterium]